MHAHHLVQTSVVLVLADVHVDAILAHVEIIDLLDVIVDAILAHADAIAQVMIMTLDHLTLAEKSLKERLAV